MASGLNKAYDSMGFSVWRDALYVLFLFLLVREWMLPIAEWSEVTGIYEVKPFLLAMIGFLLLQYFRCPLSLSVWFKALISLAVIAHFFHHESIVQMDWWRAWADTMRADLEYARAKEWHRISGETRTFLFLYGWSLAIYVVYALLHEKRMAGWFVAVTVCFLLLLQYIWGADTSAGIVRAFIVGMALVLLSRYARGPRSSSIRPAGHALVASAAVVITTTALSAWLASSVVAAKEPAPLSIQFTVAGKTGYGADHSRLGNQIEPDRQVAFIARTSKPSYWKGETRWEYDGSGWKTVDRMQLGELDVESLSGNGPLAEDGKPFGQERWVQEVMPLQAEVANILFRGGNLVAIERMLDSDGKSIAAIDLQYVDAADKFMLPSGRSLAYYRIVVSPAAHELLTDAEDYLQLPEQLPQRVSDLAASIAGSISDPFEKALELERFLQNEYEYTMERTEIPPAERDFVDHFLFEQKAGYCDHFSTAMVVMLRAEGIPARWVKGFAPGEVTGMSDGMYEVTVRNQHAHSWAEAFIPGRGWIPFEPTPGFASHEQAEGAEVQQTFAPSPPPDRTDASETSFSERLISRVSDSVVHLGERWSAIRHLAGNKRTAMLTTLVAVAAVFAVCGLIAVLAATVREWRSFRALYKLRRCRDVAEAMPLIAGLWRHWFQLYGGRQPSQTLREYVTGLSNVPNKRKQAMRRFMLESERIYYYGSPRGRGWNRKLANWWKQGRG